MLVSAHSTRKITTQSANCDLKKVSEQMNLSVPTSCRWEWRRGRRSPDGVVAHIHLKQGQKGEALWNNTELIAMDGQLPERQEGTWETKENRGTVKQSFQRHREGDV